MLFINLDMKLIFEDQNLTQIPQLSRKYFSLISLKMGSPKSLALSIGFYRSVKCYTGPTIFWGPCIA